MSTAQRTSPEEALRGLLRETGIDPDRATAVSFENEDPVLGTRFRLGDASAAALAAVGIAADDLWTIRGGRRQEIRVDLRAAAASLLSFAHQRIDGPAIPLFDPRTLLTDFYPTRDGAWVLVHNSFPPTREKTLALLDCEPSKEGVAAAIEGWEAQELEDRFAEEGLCGARVRTLDEWRACEQGRALAAHATVEILKIGDGEPQPLAPAASSPLEGIRVLDLTRVLAGPTSGRTLAWHGADVLRIASPELPFVPAFVVDTSHGKRSAYVDLEEPDGTETLRRLARDADVFTQGYRSGTLARRGFGPEALHELRPGIVYASINCYGHVGPWSTRPGWEQLAQTVTGLADAHGNERPTLLPAAATDYTTGYLSAFGIMAALRRRATEGGSYHVRVSLSRTGMWLDSLGRSDRIGAGPSQDEIANWQTTTDTLFGRVTHLRPPLRMSDTQPRWQRPTVPLGSHEPVWM